MDPRATRALMIALFLLALYLLWRRASARLPASEGVGPPEGFDAPHRYPECAAYGTGKTPGEWQQGSCAPYGVTRVNERYQLPDGRCVKAKIACAGCLDAMINDPAWVDKEAFDSCETGTDTRGPIVPQGHALQDCTAYAERYAPILAPNGADCRAANYHWTGWMRGRAPRARIPPRPRTQGRHEGLLTKPFNFDCISYLGRHREVFNWTGPDCEKARKHYMEAANEQEEAGLDLNFQVFPMCSEIPGRCVMPGNVLREATYRISYNRCVRPANATIPVERLVDLIQRGELSPHFSDGSFLSCTPGANSFADPPKVDFPGCRDRGEGCVHPGGHAKNGLRYVTANGRCLRSLGMCLGCLEEEQNRETLLEKNRVQFESCERDRDTTSVFTAGPGFYYPACRTEGPPCLGPAGHQINNARYYTMYKGRPRCLRALGECLGCLEAVNPHDRVPDQFRTAFASCSPDMDTTDRSNQTGFSGKRCVAIEKGGCLWSDGRQMKGYKYWVNQRCLRALTDCNGCIQLEMGNNDLRILPEHHMVYGSCNEDNNTTKRNYLYTPDKYPNDS